VELKALDPWPAATLEKCLALGVEDRGEIWQQDTYFCVPSGRLKLRVERPGEPHLIHYDRADQPGQRESRYRIAAVKDADGLSRVLAESLGTRGTIVKLRHLLLYKNVRIHLDAVERLGRFIELEAVATTSSDLTHEHGLIAELRSGLDIADDRLVALGYADQLLAAG
jgi:adenylate cyclase class 2